MATLKLMLNKYQLPCNNSSDNLLKPEVSYRCLVKHSVAKYPSNPSDYYPNRYLVHSFILQQSILFPNSWFSMHLSINAYFFHGWLDVLKDSPSYSVHPLINQSLLITCIKVLYYIIILLKKYGRNKALISWCIVVWIWLPFNWLDFLCFLLEFVRKHSHNGKSCMVSRVQELI